MSDTFNTALQMIMGAVVMMLFLYVFSGQYLSDKVDTEFRSKDASLTLSSILHQNDNMEIDMPLSSIGKIDVVRDESYISVSKGLFLAKDIISSNVTYIDNLNMKIRVKNDDFYAFTKDDDEIIIGALEFKNKRNCIVGKRKRFMLYDNNKRFDITNKLYENSLHGNIRISNKEDLSGKEVLLKIVEGDDIEILYPKEDIDLLSYACNIANSFDDAYTIPSKLDNELVIVAPDNKDILSKIGYVLATK